MYALQLSYHIMKDSYSGPDNNIRVTKEELDRMNRTSVQLNDGSGDYLAAIDVFHHLHCLVSVVLPIRA